MMTSETLTLEELIKIKNDEILMEKYNLEIQLANSNTNKKFLMDQYLEDSKNLKDLFEEDESLETISETSRSERNLVNEESGDSSVTQRYPKSNPVSMGYSVGHPPRRPVNFGANI